METQGFHFHNAYKGKVNNHTSISSRTACIGHQSQGRTSPIWRTTKTITVPTPGVEGQILLAIVSWFQSHQGKHNLVKHWMKQHFTYTDKRQVKISFNNAHCLCGQQVSPSSQCKAIHLWFTSLVSYGKITFPPYGNSYSSGVCQAPYDKHPQAEQRCTQRCVELKQQKVFLSMIRSPEQALCELFISW